MKWQWSDGYRAKVSASVAGKELDRLRRAGGNELSPRKLWESQKPTNAPLHKAFVWDKDQAWRLHNDDLARRMIHSIRVVEVEDGSPRIAYFHVNLSDDNETNKRSTYVPRSRVVSESDLYDQVLQEAMTILEGAQKRFSEIKELSSIFDRALGEIKKLKKKKKKKE